MLALNQGLFPQGILILEQFWEVFGFSIHNLQQSLGGGGEDFCAFGVCFILRETFGEVLIA